MSEVPNKAHAVDAPVASCFNVLDQGRRATDVQRSPTMRAKRAKPKSWRDDKITAQGKRGTSVALGYYLAAPTGRRSGSVLECYHKESEANQIAPGDAGFRGSV